MEKFFITDEQIEELKKYIPDIDGYLDDYDAFLTKCCIEMSFTFDRYDNPTDATYAMESIYDAIVYQNKR